MNLPQLLLLSAFLLFAFNGYSQTDATRQIIGGQAGFFGAWVYGEFPISSSSVMRGEIGLDGGFRGGSFYSTNTIAFAPSLRAEPRWYYNLKKRAAKGRKTDKNAANFISLQTIYQPGWFVLSNVDGTRVDNGITLLPTWGIRRMIARKISVETGLGLGYTRRWYKGATRPAELALGLHLRIGS